MDGDQFWKEKDSSFIAKELSNSDLIDSIICDLVNIGILSDDDVKTLLNGELTRMCKAKEVTYYLFRQSQTVMIEEVVEIFYKRGLKEIAEHIHPQLAAKFSTRDSNSEFGRALHELPPIPPSASLPALSTIPYSPQLPDTCRSYPDLNRMKNENIEIQVTCAENIFGGDLNDEIYRNETNPRGYVFIANVVEFDNNMYKPRTGSIIDVQNLNDLFTQMGYKVKECRNPTKGELLSALTEFTEDEKLRKVNSCIVVIMSHGFDDRSIIMSDNKRIRDMKIIEFFNNQNCPLLQDKPKIFIFQFCRGDTTDLGVDSSPLPQNVSNELEGDTFEADGMAIGETITLTTTPAFSDIYCVYATLEGYVAYLNPRRGSWLIEAICLEFMDNAYNTDLDTLMKKVSRRLKSLYSDKGRKQVPECRQFCFDKHFYFNPLPLSDPTLPLTSLRDLSDALPQNGSASSLSTISVTPPHQRRQQLWANQSRSTTPEFTNYWLNHSVSATQLRSRHSSGASSGSRGMDVFPPIWSKHAGEVDSEHRRASFSVFENEGPNCERDDYSNEMKNESHDDVDTLKSKGISGTAEDFRMWRLRHSQTEEKPSPLKRQLSAPTDTEAIHKVHGLNQYVQINNLQHLLEPLHSIQQEIVKNKNRFKKDKRETNSLKY